MKKINKLIFIVIALDFISIALMYYAQMIPIFLIQISVFLYLIVAEILKKGFCPTNDDVKLIYLSVIFWAIVFSISLIWLDTEFLQIVSYLLIISSMFRILIPRLVYYYYKHGVF